MCFKLHKIRESWPLNFSIFAIFVFKQFFQWPHYIFILISLERKGNYPRDKFLHSKCNLGSGWVLLCRRRQLCCSCAITEPLAEISKAFLIQELHSVMWDIPLPEGIFDVHYSWVLEEKKKGLQKRKRRCGRTNQGFRGPETMIKWVSHARTAHVPVL